MTWRPPLLVVEELEVMSYSWSLDDVTLFSSTLLALGVVFLFC